jgi:hypothetical protein
MRIYDDPIEVRQGLIGEQVDGPDGAAGDTVTRTEGPEQFLWHGRIWKVRTILAHWVETGEWWRLAKDDAAGERPSVDLLREREWWRVEAGRGGADPAHGWGVFELFFDWSAGSWRLAGCLD